MKRILAVFLSIAMLISYAVAEGQPDEETAHQIFNNLTSIYDSSLYYLKQQTATWHDLIVNVQSGSSQYNWFIDSFIDQQDRALCIVMFCMKNQPPFGDAENESSRDYYYTHLFKPLIDTYAGTDDQLSKAAFTLTRLLFFDDSSIEMLASQKTAIKDLKAASPNYEYINELQELYKKTSVLLDYVQENTDTYDITTQRASDFEQTRRELKSEFDFIFDWPDFTYSPQILSENMLAFYEDSENKIAEEKKARLAENERKAELYDKAVGLMDAEDYIGALLIFEELGNYKDSSTRAETCREYAAPFLEAETKYGIQIGTTVKHKEKGKGTVTKIYYTNLGEKDPKHLTIEVNYGAESDLYALPEVIKTGNMTVNK